MSQESVTEYCARKEREEYAEEQAALDNPIINHTKTEAIEAIKVLQEFMSQSELSAIADGCRGEEKQFFFNKLVELANIIKIMPVTYEQDGKGKQAIAYLHYFKNGADWYITEKDKGEPGAEYTCEHCGQLNNRNCINGITCHRCGTPISEPAQLQAFGLADLGEGFPELGYISIVELVQAGVELDLYLTPKTLAEIEKGV
jgi:hypothetical protein